LKTEFYCSYCGPAKRSYCEEYDRSKFQVAQS
jgi:hypothetical protein